MKITVVDDLTCPNCGAEEMHSDGEHCQIRAYKVSSDGGYWWSQCLVCAGYYNGINGEVVGDPLQSRDGGWF